uniref:Uncharacterized protein n=1 Tax=Stomoxys calcitrans TaxID=35570 RepID=A0A1I8P0Y7_STOCA
MASDILAKQCIIIAAFSIALCIVLICMEVEDLRIGLQPSYDSGERHSEYIRDSVFLLGEYAVSTLLSILLIIGAAKKCLVLLAPWLIAACAGTIFMVYVGGTVFLFIPFDEIGFLLPILGVSGVITLILFPVFALFCEIYLENCKKRKQGVEDQINNNNSNIMHLMVKELKEKV